ncbi:BREX-1 system adenine-specific DNA-methyltransferase PglX [Sporolactobacillus inulinus]|uniref:site-specific DNA-methyltransferase (adenine-specific) n=1 Tax=Sporolactobacillus inulinus CASD TaxID=1069536 RepID=A0A0U1QP25_9BACL|nr:BREX-1 system adenine-specific DNA-methyltransferase PglX [Sporolactobacillus inulinus]KLI02558.1 restriction endonuclease [Sporolactobacillus inulinus CASD]GEB77832.1 class I SAM-dependent DNA methyltransferase [Sporolactobacillus inulinus]
MNKAALKTFATTARRELLEKIETRALKLGITGDSIQEAEIESSDAIYIDGRQLSSEEQTQRERLIDRIHEIGFKRVLEEVAYTWFNRFTALRFMEVNDYLPTRVRVLSSTNPDSAEPDMMKEALSLDLDINKEYVYDLKMNNKSEELFKYLIIKHCNDLNRYMPFMFEKINDYTELLFPEGLLTTDSFVRRMANTEVIPEDNWEKVEVIGWLYQYYIADEKDRVIKAKKKYKTEEIPFATQLFTPDWIVRYMVQNSLGRYWLESHPEHRDLIKDWEFYLNNPNPEANCEEKLVPYINRELKVEDIKCFDPAMGSGHILVYMFDVLYAIYSKCGYAVKEIPRLILENNLYGLDIDGRAYQLACFSVVMKALEYNRRFLKSIEMDGLTLNLAAIQQTNNLNEDDIAYISGVKYGPAFKKTQEFIKQFKDAKIYGSLIEVGEHGDDFFFNRLKKILDTSSKDLFEENTRNKVLDILPKLLKQSKIMRMTYDIFVSNPPYLGRSLMNKDLSNFIELRFNEVKTDLFSAFLIYGFRKTRKTGHLAFISPFVWMTIKSYEYLRKFIVTNKTISSMIELEYNAFEVATVPVCTYTLRNYSSNISGEYIKLSDFKGIENQPIKTLEAIKNPNVYYRYTNITKNFSKIEGMPIAYWGTEKIIEAFDKNESLAAKVYMITKGIFTGDNERFIRLWHEVNYLDIQNRSWNKYSKGGGFRKWYGNSIFVVRWKNEAEELKAFEGSGLGASKYFNKEHFVWSKISSSNISFRYDERNTFFDDASPAVLFEKRTDMTLLAILNSKAVKSFLEILSPTMNFQIGDIKKIPVSDRIGKYRETVENLVRKCIYISKEDWDSFETSWDFTKHVFIKYQKGAKKISESFQNWLDFSSKQREELKQAEEKLNQLINHIYDLDGEIDPVVSDESIKVKVAEEKREVKSFISYAVGCIFGRYSLDRDGIVYAGGKVDFQDYKTFSADKDNILPILNGAYFEDDIVSKFVDFVRVTFGKDTLNENLDIVADALGRRKDETAKETLRRYFMNDFYKDHVKTYRNRPIYWLFTSGKEKAFNCLIYMHRYDKTTLSRIRTDYLHDYQIRLDAEKKDLLNIIDGDSTAKEISNAKKKLKSLDKKIDELKAYDELLHHMADMQIEIDLDDGVKVNYENFKGLVAKI